MCKAKSKGGMGFRDLTCFDQALVAKQGWRVIHFPESLMARVLQARYFKHSNFLQAKLGYNPSFYLEKYSVGKASASQQDVVEN